MSRPLLALATAVLLAVAGGAVVVERGSGASDDPAEGTTTTTATPSSVAAVVRDLQEFVADERGLTFDHDVEVTLLGDERFEARLLEDAEQDREQTEVTGRLMQAVGLLDDDDDLHDIVLRFLGSAVVGFYDPETDELVVRGGALTPYTRSTIVHELTHALDDQWFDLHRPELGEGDDDERSLAFAALVEGDAVRVEAAFRQTMSDAERAQAEDEQQVRAARIDRRGLPDVVPRIVAFPYVHGPRFVARLLEAGGEERLNRAFEEPPTTSEHILHPDRWLDGEPAADVPPPAADGPVLEEGVYGQSSLQLTLEPVVGAGSVTAADGWGGDRYVVWDAGRGRTCVRATFVMDTGDDLDELVRALRAWAREQGATVVRGPSSVAFTSCS